MVLYLGQNIRVKCMDDGCNLATSGTELDGFSALVSSSNHSLHDSTGSASPFSSSGQEERVVGGRAELCKIEGH